MSKITEAFKKGKAFIPFLTAGDPDADSTVRYILAMARAGADIIEIGIPFSDPTAEGPVIQEASLRALEGGMTMDGVFDIVRRVREESDVPLVLMTYINPVFFYGYEAFFSRCEELGVDGFISPDLPHEEKAEVADYASRHGVEVISMVAPTSGDRIPEIVSDAEGFIYVVSSMGVTGVRDDITTDIRSLIAEVKKYTDLPAAVGFGISESEQAAYIASLCDGVIVGSAIVRVIAGYRSEAEVTVASYVRRMKAAIAN